MRNRGLLIAAYVIISAMVALSPSIAKADVHVYDKNNQYLGILLEMWGNGMDLFIPAAGGVLKFLYDYTGWCEELHVFFQSNDCSGTPYDRDPNPMILDLGIISRPGFYKVDYNGKQTFTPVSYIDEACNCRTDPGEPNAEYYPYVQAQMPFSTPIELPLRFEVETKSEIFPFPIVIPKNQ